MNVWARGQARRTEARSNGGTGKVEKAKEKWEVGCPEIAGKSPFSFTVPLPP